MAEYIVRMPPDMPYEIKAELNAWYIESEPIVRCKDCKFVTPQSYCMRYWFAVEPDGFCAWGERQGEEYVHCSGCKHWDAAKCFCNKKGFPSFSYEFCAWGERRVVE